MLAVQPQTSALTSLCPTFPTSQGSCANNVLGTSLAAGSCQCMAGVCLLREQMRKQTWHLSRALWVRELAVLPHNPSGRLQGRLHLPPSLRRGLLGLRGRRGPCPCSSLSRAAAWLCHRDCVTPSLVSSGLRGSLSSLVCSGPPPHPGARCSRPLPPGHIVLLEGRVLSCPRHRRHHVPQQSAVQRGGWEPRPVRGRSAGLPGTVWAPLTAERWVPA